MKIANKPLTQLEKQLNKKIKHSNKEKKTKDLITLKSSIDFDNILIKAQEAMAKLIINLDINVKDDLIDKSYRHFNRLLLTNTENKEIHSKLMDLLKMLSFQFDQVEYVVILDYLIKKFNVLRFETRELILIFLGYHETDQFVKMMLLIHEDDLLNDEILLKTSQIAKRNRKITRKQLATTIVNSKTLQIFLTHLFETLREIDMLNFNDLNNVCYSFTAVLIEEIYAEIKHNKEKAEEVNRAVIEFTMKTDRNSSNKLKKTTVFIVLKMISSFELSTEVVELLSKKILDTLDEEHKPKVVRLIINKQYRKGLKLEIDEKIIKSSIESLFSEELELSQNINFLEYVAHSIETNNELALKIADLRNKALYQPLHETKPVILNNSDPSTSEKKEREACSSDGAATVSYYNDTSYYKVKQAIELSIEHKDSKYVEAAIEKIDSVTHVLEIVLIDYLYKHNCSLKIDKKYKIITKKLMCEINQSKTSKPLIPVFESLSKNDKCIKDIIHAMTIEKFENNSIFVEAILYAAREKNNLLLMYELLQQIETLVLFEDLPKTLSICITQILGLEFSPKLLYYIIKVSVKYTRIKLVDFNIFKDVLVDFNIFNNLIVEHIEDINSIQIILDIFSKCSHKELINADYAFIILMIKLILKYKKSFSYTIIILLQKTKIKEEIFKNKGFILENPKNVSLLNLNHKEVLGVLACSENLKILSIYVADVMNVIFTNFTSELMVDVMDRLLETNEHNKQYREIVDCAINQIQNANLHNDHKLFSFISKCIERDNTEMINRITNNSEFINKTLNIQNRQEIAKNILKIIDDHKKSKHIELLSKIIINTSTNNNEHLFMTYYSVSPYILEWIDINSTHTDVKYNSLISKILTGAKNVDELLLAKDLLRNNSKFTLNNTSITNLIRLMRNGNRMIDIVAEIFSNRLQSNPVDYISILGRISDIITHDIPLMHQKKIIVQLIKNNKNSNTLLARKLNALLGGSPLLRDSSFIKETTSVGNAYDEMVLLLLSNDVKIKVDANRFLHIIGKLLDNETTKYGNITNLNTTYTPPVFDNYKAVRYVLDHQNNKNKELKRIILNNTQDNLLVKLMKKYAKSNDTDLAAMICSSIKDANLYVLVVEGLLTSNNYTLLCDIIRNHIDNQELISKVIDTIAENKLTNEASVHILSYIVTNCNLQINHINTVINTLISKGVATSNIALELLKKYAHMFGVNQITNIINNNTDECMVPYLGKTIDYSLRFEVLNSIKITNLTIKIINESLKHNSIENIKSHQNELMNIYFTKVINHCEDEDSSQIISYGLFMLSTKLLDFKIIKAILIKVIKMDKILIAASFSLSLLKATRSEQLSHLIHDKLLKSMSFNENTEQLNRTLISTFMLIVGILDSLEILNTFNQIVQSYKLSNIDSTQLIKLSVKTASAHNYKHLPKIYKDFLHMSQKKDKETAILAINTLEKLYEKIEKKKIITYIPQTLPVIMELSISSKIKLDKLVEAMEKVNGQKLVDLIK